MGTLAEALEAATADGGRVLLLDEIMGRLDKADRATLLAALAGDVPADRLATALTTAGHKISGGAIRTWKRANVAR